MVIIIDVRTELVGASHAQAQALVQWVWSELAVCVQGMGDALWGLLMNEGGLAASVGRLRGAAASSPTPEAERVQHRARVDASALDHELLRGEGIDVSCRTSSSLCKSTPSCV
jgi:Na+-transporting methylmalonyl-CoA/oxaloacetate decarboxylase beta subunit